MKFLIALLVWCYRNLLRLYPSSFRELYKAEMEETFRQKLSNGNPLLHFLCEVRDLPMGLIYAYQRQRRLTVAAQGAGSNVAIGWPLNLESVPVELRPWIFGMVVTFIVMITALTTGAINRAANRTGEFPPLRGSSAILLEHEERFVRLPHSSFHCLPASGADQVDCTARVGGELLEVALFDITCLGRYAGQVVVCQQWYGNAKDRSLPPVVVQRPGTLTDAEWRELAEQYAFVFANTWWFYQGGIALSGVVSLMIAAMMWNASRTNPGQREGIIRLVGRMVISGVAGAIFFFPLALFSLILAFTLEDWMGRL